MDAPHNSDLCKLIEETAFPDLKLGQTLARLEELEADLAELIVRVRWQMFLGCDETSVEFLEKLDTRH